MSPGITCWGFNAGQRYVKDSISQNGKRKDLRPYPAVIAPWAKSDDTGLAKRATDLTACVGGADYIGGEAAERLPLANRQMDDGRLDLSSPTYQALAQMSAQRAHLTGHNGSRPKVIIATALPVGWRLDDVGAEEHLKIHLHTALDSLMAIKAIYVQSEPNAVVSSELLDDAGNMRDEQKELTKAVICVGDLGGGTINLSVLEALRPLPGLSASPAKGSSEVVRALMQQAGIPQYIDAERRLEAAVRAPGADLVADRLLKQYREATVSLFQEAWKSFTSAIYLFAGGTVHWVAADLQRAFSRARVAQKPQQAIAVGLYRYAQRKAQRGT